MFRILFILFLTIPILEIFLLIQVGNRIGAGWTIFLVVFTALLGAAMLRMQGLATLRRLQETAARGELPAIPMIEGAFLLVAGALLMTPGFFTDIVGFLFLIPPVRQRLAVAMLQRGVWVASGKGGFSSSQSTQQRQDAIEGEFERRDD